MSEKLCTICTITKPVSEFTPTRKKADGSQSYHTYCKPCYRDWRRPRNDPAKESARVSAYNKRNPHVAAACMRRLRAADPDHFLSYRKEWDNENRDKVAVYDANKRHKRRSAMGSGSVRPSVWNDIIKYSNGACFYCGLAFGNPTMDHFIALSVGGAHDENNIVPACSHCNSSKGATDPFVFARIKGRNLPITENITKAESVIKGEILLAIGRLPGSIFWNNATGVLKTSHGTAVKFGLIGSPDIIGCYYGRFIGIEVKTATGKQRESQINFQKAFEKAGGVYVVCRSADEAVSAIEGIQ